ncbi:MAG: AraC family transcriptional regulator [Pleurocapsa sp.]
MLQQYCSKKINLKGYGGGLSSIKLKQAIEYINDNLENKIELKNIAEELDISLYYFSRLFRQSLGVSPYKYVIEQRVEKAKQL